MNRPVHFEIHVDDPGRAAEFYKNVFGWEFKKWEEQEYWLIMTGEGDTPGIDGGMVRRKGLIIEGAPVNASVLSMDVLDINETIGLVNEFGGKVVVPVMVVAEVGWVAYCEDTEGNIFGIMQNDTTAQEMSSEKSEELK